MLNYYELLDSSLRKLTFYCHISELPPTQNAIGANKGLGRDFQQLKKSNVILVVYQPAAWVPGKRSKPSLFWFDGYR